MRSVNGIGSTSSRRLWCLCLNPELGCESSRWTARVRGAAKAGSRRIHPLLAIEHHDDQPGQARRACRCRLRFRLRSGRVTPLRELPERWPGPSGPVVRPQPEPVRCGCEFVRVTIVTAVPSGPLRLPDSVGGMDLLLRSDTGAPWQVYPQLLPRNPAAYITVSGIHDDPQGRAPSVYGVETRTVPGRTDTLTSDPADLGSRRTGRRRHGAADGHARRVVPGRADGRHSGVRHVVRFHGVCGRTAPRRSSWSGTRSPAARRRPRPPPPRRWCSDTPWRLLMAAWPP
jgi:hypothetical protein